MPITVEELKQGLVEHDKGVLKHGAHRPEEREYCALEFVSIMRQDAQMNDTPGHLPDLRPLNDASWSSDEERTEHMLPVLAALWDWETWTQKRRQAFATKLAIETVKQIVSQLPSIGSENRTRCLNVVTLACAACAACAADAADAACAADAARTAAAAYAARAAAAAAYAAGAAAAAAAAARAASAASAADAAADTVLSVSCQIFVDAAQSTEGT